MIKQIQYICATFWKKSVDNAEKMWYYIYNERNKNTMINNQRVLEREHRQESKVVALRRVRYH